MVAGYYGFNLVISVSVRLSYVCPYFRFRTITSRYQWIFAKLGMCIFIVESWFRIANGQISLIYDGGTCPRHAQFSFPDDNLSKYQWIFAKLGLCIDIVKI